MLLARLLAVMEPEDALDLCFLLLYTMASPFPTRIVVVVTD